MIRTLNVIDMYHGNDIAAKTGLTEPQVFAALKAAGVYAIIHKASQGTQMRDGSYSERRKMVKDAGMLWGAYHFLDATNEVDQADHFLDCAAVTSADFDLPSLWCDFEDYPHSQAALSQCQAFMKRIDQMAPPPIVCGLYSGNRIRETLTPPTSGHVHQDMQGAMQFFQLHRLWMAEYGPVERIPWPWSQPIVKTGDQSTPAPAPGVFLWQYTEQGTMKPLHGYTDGSFFDGTFDQLKARWLS